MLIQDEDNIFTRANDFVIYGTGHFIDLFEIVFILSFTSQNEISGKAARSTKILTVIHKSYNK